MAKSGTIETFITLLGDVAGRGSKNVFHYLGKLLAKLTKDTKHFWTHRTTPGHMHTSSAQRGAPKHGQKCRWQHYS